MAEFSLLTAHVRDVMVDNRSTFPFLRTEVGYAGFERKGILYERERRICGKSKYNFLRMTQFAVAGILSSSTFLLRLAAYLAPGLLLLNLVLLGLDLWDGYDKAFRLLVAGDLMFLVFFTTAVCVYLARVYKNGVDRPVFIVDWSKSALDPPAATAPEGVARRVWTTNRSANGPDPLPLSQAPANGTN
jgi:dolichol-phosphate mannosyltransferase